MASDVPGGDLSGSASAQQAFGPYARAIRRHWKLVTVVTLLAAVVAAATVSRIPRTYEASASILVTPLPAGNSSFLGLGTVIESGDPARTVQTAAALITTEGAASKAAKTLGRPWTPGNVLSAVSVAPRGASDVLAITAKAANGTDAARVANAFAHGAIAYRAGIVQQELAATLTSLQAQLASLGAARSTEAQALATKVADLRTIQGSGREPTLSVSQTALPAGSPTGAPSWLIIGLALVGGFALGSVAALGLETFSRPVRDEAELADLYPIPILATVPRVRHRRGHDLAPWEFSPEAFEQMRLLRVQISMGIVSPVIMVTSAGSGDGKTTIAAGLAAAFAEVEEDVILMDLDFRKPDLGRLLEVEPSNGIFSALPSGVPIPVPRLPGVKLIPAPTGDIASFENLLRRLPDVLVHARHAAGAVILDTAPVGQVSETLRIAPLCNEVLFVARPRHTDRRRLTLSRQLLDRAGAHTAGMVLVGQDPPSGGEYYSYGYAPSLHPAPAEETEAEISPALADGRDKPAD